VVIVDTTVWIDYFRNVENSETLWLESQLERQRLGLTDLILCEVLQGIRDQHEFSSALGSLKKFHIFPAGGIGVAVAAAENYRKLRKVGYTVRKTIDCLIATFCLLNRHELLHRDRDFDCFEQALGLRVVRTPA
jgi:predicted nucleic acid-binding protein